jgi:hypothetical protein
MLQPADWGIGLWDGAWGEPLPGSYPSTRNGPSLEARISTDGPFPLHLSCSKLTFSHEWVRPEIAASTFSFTRWQRSIVSKA